MILSKIFKFTTNKKYDMDTLVGINSIPVPAKNYNTGDPTRDCIYYLLQRKATEHKRNGNMDLAIACLRKSNELSDYADKPLLTQKDYLRLVKYLEYNMQNDEAEAEKAKIFKLHPEFLDKRVSNLTRIKETIKKNKKSGNDLVRIDTPNNCPICNRYKGKIYSISGLSEKFPKLPDEIAKNGGFCPNCLLGISCYFDKNNK